jgi:hypothetical protein
LTALPSLFAVNGDREMPATLDLDGVVRDLRDEGAARTSICYPGEAGLGVLDHGF